MSKRCSTPMPCKFEDHCAHKQLPHAYSTGFFWPPNTGEDCQYYELHTPTPEQVAEKLARLVRAHQ